jgi:hypothetical protein
VQVAATFSDTETARRSMCLNPSILVAGVQTFIAFKIPSAQSAGTAVEVWLTDVNGQYRVSTSVAQSSSGQQLKLNSGESASVQLNVNTPYIIIIEVDSSASFLTSQVLTTVSHIRNTTYIVQDNEALASVNTYITDDQLINALSTDQFYICISLASFASRRVQAKSVSLDVNYFGSAPGGALGKSSSTSSNSGAIAGAIIGAVLGAIALTSVIGVVIVLLLAYYVQRRGQVPVKQEDRKSVEMQEVYTPPSSSTNVYDQLPTHNAPETIITENAEQEPVIVEPVVPEVVAEEQQPIDTATEQEPENVVPTVEQEPDNVVLEFPEVESAKSQNNE